MCWEWGLKSSTESCARQNPEAGCRRLFHTLSSQRNQPVPQKAQGSSELTQWFVDTGIWGPRHPKSRDWLFPTLPLSKTRSVKQWGQVPDVTLPGFKSRFTTSETTHPWRRDPASPFLRL